MAESKLLQEAIADAKAVRETAIANAKLALEEAFTPKLQSMLSKKIEEEADDTKDEEMKEQTDSSGIGEAMRLTSRGYREINHRHFSYSFTNNVTLNSITFGDRTMIPRSWVKKMIKIN